MYIPHSKLCASICLTRNHMHGYRDIISVVIVSPAWKKHDRICTEDGWKGLEHSQQIPKSWTFLGTQAMERQGSSIFPRGQNGTPILLLRSPTVLIVEMQNHQHSDASNLSITNPSNPWFPSPPAPPRLLKLYILNKWNLICKYNMENSFP